MLEEHLEWANASYYHSSEGTVNSNVFGDGSEKLIARNEFFRTVPCDSGAGIVTIFCLRFMFVNVMITLTLVISVFSYSS